MLSDERVRELASEAYQEVQIWDYDLPIVEAISAAVAEAVAAEREACAKLIKDEEGWEWAYHTGDDPPFPMGRISYSTRHNIAAAIRARGESDD